MAYISAPPAPDGERWFHKIDHETETLGVWHLGSVALGKTWPAGRARCGFEQTAIAVGNQETAGSISAPEQSICAECLRSLASELSR